jgi:hypothetical protein
VNSLVNVNIPAPQDPALTGGQAALAMSEGFVVCDSESYEMAGAEVRRIAGVVKRLEDLRLTITRPLDVAKQNVMNLFRAPTEQYVAARSTIERKMIGFRQEEQRRVAEQERQAREAAERERVAREAKLLEEAEALQKAGDAERAQAKLEEAAAPPPPPPVVMQEPPRAAGTSVRALWRAECTDLDALIKAAAAGHQLARACRVADPKVLGAQARALKDGFKVPGIRVWSDDSIAART